MPNQHIRVLCVEDHAIVREGIGSLIGLQPNIEVVGAVATGEEAVATFAKTRPDVTLMDLQLPGMSGVEAIAAIRRDHPDARIIVLTMYRGDTDIRSALNAGAVAYLLKDTLSDELVRVIREVHGGGRPVESHVQTLLRRDAAQDAAQFDLTGRELEVLELIAQGMRNKEIGARLHIMEQTVQVHVKNILAKLEVHDRTAAVVVAAKRGIIRILN